VYVTNSGTNIGTGSATMSEINTATNTVTTVQVGPEPYGIVLSPDGKLAYVAVSNFNFADYCNLAVFNTFTNTVVTYIPIGINPVGVAINADGSKVYVANSTSGTVSVINTATNTVIANIAMDSPIGIAISPDGKTLYVTNFQANTVSVVDASTDVVTANINVGKDPQGISISPDGSKVYVANIGSNTVSVINTVNNAVTATIAVASNPNGLCVSPDGDRVYAGSSVINTATNTVVATVTVPNASFGNFVSAPMSCGGASAKFTITVNPSLPTITVTVATGIISACAGTVSASPNIQQFAVSGIGLTGNITATAPAGFEVSLSSGSGYGNSIILSQTGGAVSNTPVYVRSAASLANGTTTASVILSSPGAPSQTVSVTGLVNLNVTASLVISASENNVCAGTQITFTATPTNGGSSPVYQWLLNGNNASTSSPTFSSSTFTNGDVVSCVMTSSGACVAPANITSNSVTINVNADVIPSINIVASQNTVCAGTMVTFTATQMNGGSVPVYQWLVNGNNAGTNNATYSNSNLADGDKVSCMITSNALCAAPATVTSNSINMSVSPLVSPAISIEASANSICAGANVTFTATPGNGGSSPVYQWLLNGNNIGSNSPAFSSSTLANGDVISCRISSNATCLTISDAISNNIIMVVNAALAPSLSINISANKVCAGTLVTFSASPANGGSSPVYQWLLNGNNAGSNSPTFSSSTFANGDLVSCVLTSNLTCAAPVNITSNTIIVNIFPLPVVTAGGNRTIEEGSSVTLTAIVSGDIADITWSPATGLNNNKILTPRASPSSSTSYIITVQSAAGCMASDSVTVTVLDGIVIPNTFTPNGDGINDTWIIKHLDAYPQCSVQIFTRWGQNVYTSTGYGIPWDGTYRGTTLPTGTYYYVIDLKNNSQLLSGFVAIVR
jgi:gliding motility-associated-like protein